MLLTYLVILATISVGLSKERSAAKASVPPSPSRKLSASSKVKATSGHAAPSKKASIRTPSKGSDLPKDLPEAESDLESDHDSAPMTDAESPLPDNSLEGLDSETRKGWLERGRPPANRNILSLKGAEEEMGISEFINKKAKGTGGFMKMSWSDFRVMEVNMDGALVVLKDSEPPEQPEDCGFLRFILAKAGYETEAAVSMMARFLGVERSRFSYAGTKEKSAITCQLMSVSVTPEPIEATKLCEVNAKFPRIAVGGFEYSKEAVLPGQHAGNFYTVLLRNLTVKDSSKIDEAVDAVKSKVSDQSRHA